MVVGVLRHAVRNAGEKPGAAPPDRSPSKVMKNFLLFPSRTVRRNARSRRSCLRPRGLEESVVEGADPLNSLLTRFFLGQEFPYWCRRAAGAPPGGPGPIFNQRRWTKLTAGEGPYLAPLAEGAVKPALGARDYRTWRFSWRAQHPGEIVRERLYRRAKTYSGRGGAAPAHGFRSREIFPSFRVGASRSAGLFHPTRSPAFS